MSFSGFLKTVEVDVENIFEAVFHAAVATAKPVLVATVNNAETAFLNAAASGKMSNIGSVLGEVAIQAGKDLEAKEIQTSVPVFATAFLSAVMGNPKVSAAVTGAPTTAPTAP